MKIIKASEFKNYKDTSGIYAVINTECPSPYFPLGKVYIGQAHKITRRLWDHLLVGRRNEPYKHSNIHLWRAFKKYGEDAFAFAILEECSPEELTNKEDKWINETKANNPNFGYNKRMASDSNQGSVFKPLSIEVIKEWILKFASKYKAYPTQDSGIIEWSKNKDTWRAIDLAFKNEQRSLPKTTLSKFIFNNFNYSYFESYKRITPNDIKRWCEFYRNEHGKLPVLSSKRIIYAEKEGFGCLTWSGLSSLMLNNNRGLKTNISLTKFVSEQFEIINRRYKPFSMEYITKWITQYCRDNNEIPKNTSGFITYAEVDGFGKATWNAVNKWLTKTKNITLNKLCEGKNQQFKGTK
jgi:hypothetical protein